MSSILNNIPATLEKQLFGEYSEIKKQFLLNEDRPSQLSGGRFAEVILRIFQHLLGDSVTPFGTEIKAQEKDRIINRVTNDPQIDEHVRQKVTSLIRLLLDFRNNRDVAHLGGLKANKIDAQFILSASNWITAEMIRVFGNYSIDDAQQIIDAMASPSYPVLYKIEGEDYIARPDLKAWEEVLVLLISNTRTAEELFEKTKDNNRSRFIKTLDKMEQKDRMIAKSIEKYHIMPLGIKTVHERNLLNLD